MRSLGCKHHTFFRFARGLLQGSGNIVVFEVRKIAHNLSARCATRQLVEDVADADAQTANAGTAPALARIERNAVEKVGGQCWHPYFSSCYQFR